MKKTLLFLGGAEYQVPAIKEAVEQGYHVVVCGYNADDPGNKYADEYHNISIADIDKVVKLARKVNADYVLGYVSETAVTVAAHVADKLGLPGTSVHVLEKLTQKDQFRNIQKQHGFPYPRFKLFENGSTETEDVGELNFPIILKPVDSCGSRGVTRIEQMSEFKAAADEALQYSTKKRFIAEEVIDPENRQYSGDGFMVNGQLKFLCLGDHLYEKNTRSTVAYGTTWPSLLDKGKQKKIHDVLEKQLNSVGYLNGPVNADVRLVNDDVFIIEAAPRNGANFTPQLIQCCTGVNLVKALYQVLEGISPSFKITYNRFAAAIILHSNKSGILSGITIDRALEQMILKKSILNVAGDTVHLYRNLGDALGIVLFVFNTRAEMNRVIENINKHISIHIER